jgi:E3 ubiquitin-protein ligase CCNP1IP1
MVVDMVCNFNECRKPLKSFAWVTSCSHAFCEEHGDRDFADASNRSEKLCPACETHLTEKYDVVHADLDPPEQFRSIVLAGLQPHVVMDVASRAISFWSYQVSEECSYQAHLTRRAVEVAKGAKERSALGLHKYKIELENDAEKIRTLQNDLMEQKRMVQELSAKLEDKTRKMNRVQHQLECHMRKSFRPNPEPVIEDDDEPKKTKFNIMDAMTEKMASPRDQFLFRPNLKKDSDSQAAKFNFALN